MYRWKTTANLVGVTADGEVFDENWMDSSVLAMPPHPEWGEQRPPRFEEIDIWEVICEWSGLSGVYAAWCPYAEYYIVMDQWQITEEFAGPNANARLEQYLVANNIPYPKG